MTLAVEDVNPKLVDVAAFADADSEERVDHCWLVTADSLATACHVRQQLDKSFFQHLPSVSNIFFIRTQLVLSLFVFLLGIYFVKSTQSLDPFCL